MKSPTIQDIAKLAQVSKSTVSRVFSQTTPVRPDKRQAVMDAAEKLGFQPSFLAQSLARGRSMTIGVITQNLGSPFYDAIAQGVLQGLEGSEYSALFADGRWRAEVERQVLKMLIGRQVDGLVLIGGQIPEQELTDTCVGIPRVVVGRRLPDKRHCCLYVDNVEGGYLATRHLIENGHQRIAFIGGLTDHPDANDRLAGYRKAIVESGLAFDSDLVRSGDFSAASGYEAIESLIREKQTFSAVFAANDMTAFGARLALHRHRIDVPAEVSIVGYDNQAESAYTVPPLTTIQQPATRLGQAASESILAILRGEEVKSRCFHVDLCQRESVTRVKN